MMNLSINIDLSYIKINNLAKAIFLCIYTFSPAKAGDNAKSRYNVHVLPHGFSLWIKKEQTINGFSQRIKLAIK